MLVKEISIRKDPYSAHLDLCPYGTIQNIHKFSVVKVGTSYCMACNYNMGRSGDKVMCCNSKDIQRVLSNRVDFERFKARQKEIEKRLQ